MYAKNCNLVLSSHNLLLMYGHPINPSRPNINVVEFPKSELKEFKIDMCEQPYQRLDAKLNDYKNSKLGTPQILSNGGFFATSTGDSIFNIISNGKVYSRDTSDNRYRYGFGVATGKTGETYNPYEIKYGNVDEYFWRDFMTAYPVLVNNGVAITNDELNKNYSDINYKAYRNSFGWTKNQECFFFISIMEKCKLNVVRDCIFELYPNVEYAFGLDGGGSVDTYVDGNIITPDDYQRKLDNCIGVWLRTDAEREAENKPETMTIYRCQLGAWKNKTYCENYLKKVQALKTDVHDYSDAYIRQEDGYWKIKCGAFSVYSNALKMKNDLIAHGFDCYITTYYK